jgi:hypothetical protein
LLVTPNFLVPQRIRRKLALREQRNKAGKKGTSHTQEGDDLKVAQPKEVDNLSGNTERALAEEKMRAQAAKEQVSEAMTHLARELCSLGGPLLSDVLDANHKACYLALEAEKNRLAPNMFNGDCVFTVMETWQQQCVEMVRQSGGDDKHYAALADEEWLDQQDYNLMRKRREQSLADDSEPLRTFFVARSFFRVAKSLFWF